MTPLLTACLIVRDEEARLPACLAALAGLVDEVVVVDTGSTDRTVAVAQEAGARVAHRPWDDDFAAARNAALDLAGGDWVLSVDADEVVSTDARALRAALAADGVPAAALVRVLHRADSGGDHEVQAVKLFRRAGARWHGRIHERVVVPSGETAVCPVPVLFDHSGYTGGGVKRKAARNLALARAALAAETRPAERARLQLETGRALLGLERHAEAVEVLRAATAAPGATGRAAMVHLVRALLATDDPVAAVEAAAALRAAAPPAEQPLVDLLEGEALLHTGDAAGAVAMLAPLAAMAPPLDAEGRTPPAGAPAVALALALALLARHGDAADALLTAVRQGADPQVELPLLLHCWHQAGRTTEALAAALPADTLTALAAAAAADVDAAVTCGPLLLAADRPGPLTARLHDTSLGLAARLQAGLLALLSDEPDPQDHLADAIVGLAGALDAHLVAVLADDLDARHPQGAAALDAALSAAGRHPFGVLKTPDPRR